MSNEYKEWLSDRVIDIAFENKLIDNIDYFTRSQDGKYNVFGFKNGIHVAYNIWWNHIEEEWQYKRVD